MKPTVITDDLRRHFNVGDRITIGQSQWPLIVVEVTEHGIRFKGPAVEGRIFKEKPDDKNQAKP